MGIEVPLSEVFNAFDDVTKVIYSKEGIEKAKQAPSFFASGDSRSIMFQQRYYMILQQLFRDSKFVDTARGKRGADFPIISFGFGGNKGVSDEPIVNSQSLFHIHSSGEESASSWKFEVTPVESLPGSTGVKVVFGMLTRGENGKLYVEDIHQSVPIKIEHVQSSNDFITENTFVLLKGEVVDEIFVVSEMTLPPIPQRSLCESSLNLFGGHPELTEEIVINTVGEPPEDSSIAVLYNVLLDNPKTLDKLQQLFTGFEECDAIPSAFVLMGDFQSRPFNASSGDSYRAFQKSFDTLSQLLARHPLTLERSQIILVPGTTDPGHGIYPQPPFSDSLARGIASRFPNVVLATNPCRLRFYSKQITCFNGDTVDTLRKNRVVANYNSATEGSGEGDRIVRCLLSQMHLCPGPVRDKAVIWDHDAGLRMYPPPHALFCGALWGEHRRRNAIILLPDRLFGRIPSLFSISE